MALFPLKTSVYIASYRNFFQGKKIKINKKNHKSYTCSFAMGLVQWNLEPDQDECFRGDMKLGYRGGWFMDVCIFNIWTGSGK